MKDVWFQRCRAVIAGATIATGCSTTIAVAESGESDAARQCATREQDVERLACYDALFRLRGPEATESQRSPAVASGATPADFGLSERQIRRTRPNDVADPEPSSISSPITHLKRLATGELVATLENGQVWQQTDSTANFGLRPGDTVTVKRAAMGSFFMTVPGQPALRVRRIH